MTLRQTIAAVLLFVISRCAYCEDINLIVGDPDQATANAVKWAAAWAATPPKIVTLPLGRIFVAPNIIKTKAVDGCARLESLGASGYTVAGNPSLTGSRSIVIIQGAGRAVLLCGSGFYCRDPIEWEQADPDSDFFEVEGRGHDIATGRHYFANQVFLGGRNCFRTLAGYYNGENFVAEQQHGDNCLVENCESFGCQAFFSSENEQSVNWTFRTIRMNSTAGIDGFTGRSGIFADIVRGGNVICDDLVGNDPKLTVFRVRIFSPNTNDLICRGLRVDRFERQEFYTRLFEYNGPTINPASPPQWNVTIQGAVKTYQTNFLKSRSYKVPSNFVLDKTRIDVVGITR